MVEIDPKTGAPVTSPIPPATANTPTPATQQTNNTNDFVSPPQKTDPNTNATGKGLLDESRPVDERNPVVTKLSDNRPNTAPFNNPDANVTKSSDFVADAETKSFTQVEEEHPHANLNTPNTTMSGGPFNPATFDKPGSQRLPVKDYVRNPLQATGDPAVPVALQDKPLNEVEVRQKIAEILKNNGMDSASQNRAFAEIISVLNAWEPADSDVVRTRDTVKEEYEQQKQEVRDNLMSESQKKRDEISEADAQTRANLQKSEQSAQTVKA